MATILKLLYLYNFLTCLFRFCLGDYSVNITFDDAHVPNSPFTVPCQEPVDASKVKCKGPGISNSVPASLPATFTVDATKAGKAPLECEVDGPGGVKVPCDIKDNGDRTFEVSYVPDKKGTLIAFLFRFLVIFIHHISKCVYNILCTIMYDGFRKTKILGAFFIHLCWVFIPLYKFF